VSTPNEKMTIVLTRAQCAYVQRLIDVESARVQREMAAWTAIGGAGADARAAQLLQSYAMLSRQVSGIELAFSSAWPKPSPDALETVPETLRT
jgi:hypothetical protein